MDEKISAFNFRNSAFIENILILPNLTKPKPTLKT